MAGDSVFRCLAGLRRAVVTDLTTRGAELPRVRSVTLPGTVPALVAAYRIMPMQGVPMSSCPATASAIPAACRAAPRWRS